MTAAAFGLMALVLVGPVPDRLSRATWPLHAPRAAMALWQAIAVAAVLSAFSCGLAIAANLLVPEPTVARPPTLSTRSAHSASCCGRSTSACSC